MDRLGFLKRLALPVATVAATQAARLDPDGQPIRELDGAIIVNGDNVTLQNMQITVKGEIKTAIRLNESSGGTVRNNIITSSS